MTPYADVSRSATIRRRRGRTQPVEGVDRGPQAPVVVGLGQGHGGVVRAAEARPQVSRPGGITAEQQAVGLG